MGTEISKFIISHGAIFMKRVTQRTVKGLEDCDMGCAILNRLSREGKGGNA